MDEHDVRRHRWRLDLLMTSVDTPEVRALIARRHMQEIEDAGMPRHMVDFHREWHAVESAALGLMRAGAMQHEPPGLERIRQIAQRHRQERQQSPHRR